VIVREAHEGDVDALLRMARAFYPVSGYDRLAPFCEDATRALVAMLMGHGILLVAESLNKRVVGMVGLMIGPGLCNHTIRMAHEVVWWVEPEARRTNAAVLLLRAVEPAAKDLGCVAAQMIHLTSSPPQAALLYRRMGYVLTESSYTKIFDREVA
jgi:GNAT superfamily N-acetyltransferase